jgi:beta-1,4-mannosyl-glycoprotein beta-1,4-N-acetylglucosaminyltransferase
MIVDCFTFYNELEMLYYRLSVLNDSVDYFVLVESNQTFAGNSKKLFYNENKHLFEKYNHKIVHVIVDLPFIYPNINYQKNDQWSNKHFQRNSIDIGLKRLSLDGSDIIIISDVDEIPDPSNLKGLIVDRPISCMQDMYYYNLYTKHREKWFGSKILTYDMYKETTPQEIREKCYEYKCLYPFGWHLSYFGDTSFIENKLKEFSHQEFNYPEFTDQDKINERINTSTDLFGRHSVPIDRVELSDNTYLPPLYETYLQKFYKDKEDKEKRDIIIYIHECCLNDWKEVFDRILFKIKHSGLYDKTAEIRCVILGEYDNSINDPKIQIVYKSPDTSLFERVTINKIYNDSTTSDNNILYLHTKGVSYERQKQPYKKKNVYDWMEYMLFFTIYNYKKCLTFLEKYNGVAVNLTYFPTLHFSGNIWWSKSSHIRNLGECVDMSYCGPEFWLTKLGNNFMSLWNSNTNHYETPYSEKEYASKEHQNNTCKMIEQHLLQKMLSFYTIDIEHDE